MNSTDKNGSGMPLSKKAVCIFIAGVVLMLLGYVLMAGGGVKDPQVFNYAMFDFRRLVAAPLAILAGIAVIIVSIMGKFEDK